MGSSLKGLRLFQSFSVCLRFFSVIASWFGLFHVASAVFKQVSVVSSCFSFRACPLKVIDVV